MSEEIKDKLLTPQERKTQNKQRKRQLKKQKQAAKVIVASADFSTGNGSDTSGIQPDYFVPQLENASLDLPKHRNEIISWCDYYYQTNELIGSAIDIHSALSVSDIAITCSDPAVEKEYRRIYEQVGGIDLLLQIAFEFWRVGNVFPWGNWDTENKEWVEFVLIPPTTVDLKKQLLSKDPQIYLMNQAIQNSYTDNTIGEDYQEKLRELLGDRSLENENILLPNKSVSHIANKAIAGTLWGVPSIFRCFKSLVLYDKMFRSREIIADGLILPYRILQVLSSDDRPVSKEVIEDLVDQLSERAFDSDKTIVTSAKINDLSLSAAGKIYDFSRELEFLETMIASGMKLNKAVIHGEGPTYANAQVYQETMSIQYQLFRTRLSDWLKNKFFKRIAEERGYYDKETANDTSTLFVSKRKSKLLLPEISWRNNVTYDRDAVQTLKELQDKGLISKETFVNLSAPFIDYNHEQRKLLDEAKQDEAVEDIMEAEDSDIKNNTESVLGPQASNIQKLKFRKGGT